MANTTKSVKAQFADLYKEINELGDKQTQKLLPWSERSERVERSKVDPFFFYKTYLPHYFKNKPAQFHYDLVQLFAESHDNMLLVVCAPRGAAKSTFIGMETLRLSVLGLQKFMVRVEKSHDIAKNEIHKLREEIESNAQLFEDFKIKPSSPWTSTELYFSNGTLIWGRGAKQPVRGVLWKQWRPTAIIYNDIEDHDQVLNQELTDRIYNAIFTESMPALNPISAGGGLIAVVGTVLGENSVMSQLLYNTPLVRKVKYPALRGDTEIINLLLDKVSEDVYEFDQYIKNAPSNTGQEDDKNKIEKYKRNFFLKNPSYTKLMKKVKSYWPDRFTVVDLVVSMAFQRPENFKQEYLHIPTLSANNSPFPPSLFKTPHSQYHIDDIPDQNLVRAVFLDPSAKDTKQSDEKAFVTVFYDVDENVCYVIDVTAGQTTFQKMVQTSFKLVKDFLNGHVYIHGRKFESHCFVNSIFGYEDNGTQGWLEPVLRDNEEKYECIIPRLTGITHTGNKIIRISQLQYYIERGLLRFLTGNEEQLILKNQLIELLDKNVHDDRADALEGAFSLVNKTTKDVIMEGYDLYEPYNDRKKHSVLSSQNNIIGMYERYYEGSYTPYYERNY